MPWFGCMYFVCLLASWLWWFTLSTSISAGPMDGNGSPGDGLVLLWIINCFNGWVVGWFVSGLVWWSHYMLLHAFKLAGVVFVVAWSVHRWLNWLSLYKFFYYHFVPRFVKWFMESFDILLSSTDWTSPRLVVWDGLWVWLSVSLVCGIHN